MLAGQPELGEPPLEEAPLGVRVDELERTRVGRAGVVDPVEPAQKFRASRVEIVVAVELEPVDEGERCVDVARLGDRGRPVQLDDR